jgi:hypothetical protein
MSGRGLWNSPYSGSFGNNDLGEMMFNPLTGGGYDGLTANGPNMNQGAESTLALLSTLQRAQLLEMAP